MPKRVFKEEEKERYREAMLAAGFPLLREFGMTHMSVAKITQAAGIGVSTFYNFFPSKEAYIYEVLQYQRRKIPELIQRALAGKEKAGREEVRAYLRMMIDEEISIFPYLTPKDEQRLLEMMPEQFTPDLAQETKTAEWFFAMIDHPKENPDYAVIANLIKIYVFAAEERDMLHGADGYERTMERLRDLILYEIFGPSGKFL